MAGRGRVLAERTIAERTDAEQTTGVTDSRGTPVADAGIRSRVRVTDRCERCRDPLG